MDVTGPLIFLLLGLLTSALAVHREFHFVNQLKTWTEAQSYCREKFADLATIESADDWARVRKAINSDYKSVWIGLYEGVQSWRWSLDNTLLSERDYGSWFVFSTGNMRENCAYLRHDGLFDGGCGEIRYPVCYDEISNSYIPRLGGSGWPAARHYCRQQHTDLASIRNQQEWNHVMSQIDTNGGWWVGLSASDSWKWSDQSESSFRLWKGDEPNGPRGTCAAALGNGWIDLFCHTRRVFICSAPQRKVLKVTLKTDGSVNMNDPQVQEALLQQMEEDLRRHGVHQFRLSWRKQLHGDVFNKREL